MQMAYKGVAELTPRQATTLIEIRVIRKWVPAYRDDEVHYVFVDAEGMGIQAMAKGRNKFAVEPKLRMGLCYQIEKYACVDPDDYTNTLSHSAFIFLAQASEITPLPDCTVIQEYFFDIATRRRAIAAASHEGIVDYIGIFRGIVDRKTTRNQPYVVMTLRDTSNQDVTIAVWEEMLNSRARFNRAEYESASPPVILALTGLRAKDYFGTLQFQTTNATYTYRDPITPETQILIDMYENQDLQPQPVIQLTGQEISIAALKKLPANQMTGKNFIIKCTIDHISAKNSWYYTACQECSQVVLENGPVWFCSQHADVSAVKYLYLIHATLTDDSETIEATFFDRTVSQLLEISCGDIMLRSDKDTLVQGIKNRELQLQIQATRDKKSGIARCTVTTAAFVVPHNQHASQTTTVPAAPITPLSESTGKQVLQSPVTPLSKTDTSATSKSDASTKRSLMTSEAFHEEPNKKKAATGPKT